MKTISLLFIFLFSSNLLFAENEKQVKAELKEATVFLNKAQLTSTGTTTLDAGVNDVVFYGLPAGIDPQSIQVSGKGNFVILSVKYDQNYMEPHKKSSELKKLEDSLQYYEFQLQTLHNYAEVIKKEEQLIIANQNINGKEKALDADDLEYMADFFRKRLLDMRYQLLKNDREIKDMNLKVSAFRNQLAQLRQQLHPTGRITVSTQGKAKTSGTFELSYIVQDAGWYPIYDIRAKNIESPIQLAYKAQVWQKTGMNWKDISITLSTTNPSVNGIKPELSAWWINLEDKKPSRTRAMERSSKKANKPVVWDLNPVYYDSVEAEAEAESTDDYTVMTSTSLATSLKINLPYSIPTGGKGQLVDIRNIELPATYKHSTVPKAEMSSFLVAHITNWDTLDLISGNANVFFEGAFVGESYLDVENTQDTLTFSLGRDNNVVVERKAVKDLTSKTFLGFNRKQEYAYDITIRNTKRSTVYITVEDQVPVSKNEKLEVELIDAAGAEFNKETGKLTWKLEIKPGETVTKRFRYSIKHPSGKVVRDYSYGF